MNILLVYPWEWFGELAENIQEKNPDIKIMTNFEQLLAMVKEGIIERICIIFGGYAIPGDEVAQKIHEIKPDMPILVWDSYGQNQSNSSNITYLSNSSYNKEEFYAIIKEFFKTGSFVRSSV